MIASVIKLSKALAEVPRKVERALTSPRRMGKGDGGWGGWVKFTQVMAYKDFSIPLIAGDTKHFMAFPYVPRKVERGLIPLIWMGEGFGLSSPTS
jgi:hypothetical protein